MTMANTDFAFLAADVVDDGAASLPIEARIERFLAGESDGADVLRLLYGAVIDERLPERFRTLLGAQGPRLVIG